MTQNLFAACRHNSTLVTRRIRLDASVQNAIRSFFEEQEHQFRDGIQTEVDFNGDWNPETEEFLTIDIPQEAEIFEETINANATSIQDINAVNFCDENIKALFVGSVNDNGNTKILVQRFTSRQFLQRKWSLLQNGNTFRKLTEPSFSLDTALTCIIEGGKIKFKSQFKLRSIIDMQNIYREATDQEVGDFVDHNNLEVANIEDFLNIADQTTRKLIKAIIKSDILNKYSVDEIVNAGLRIGIDIATNSNKIVIPRTKADIKNLLRFLDDNLYKAALTRNIYITNSKKRTV